jgi:hypothetical protein
MMLELRIAGRDEMRAGFHAELGVGFCVKSNVGFGAMANALCAGYTPRAGKMFRKMRGAEGFSRLNSSQFRCDGFSPEKIGVAALPTQSVRGPVFLAAGGEQNRCNKNHDDDGDDEKRRSNVHDAGSLLNSD